MFAVDSVPGLFSVERDGFMLRIVRSLEQQRENDWRSFGAPMAHCDRQPGNVASRRLD
jgi:hypothetical protein